MALLHERPAHPNDLRVSGRGRDALSGIPLCDAAIESRSTLQIGVLNAAKIVNADRDEKLRDALLTCDAIFADGQAVVWASRVLGQPLPERVAGIDLFENLLQLANEKQYSVYLLGATAEVLDRVVCGQ